MTGVTGLAELVAAAPRLRPTYLAADLRGLLVAHAAPVDNDNGSGWSAGGWTASVDAGRLSVTGAGEPSDWWRAVAGAAWSALDVEGSPVDPAGVRPPEQATPPGTLPT